MQQKMHYPFAIPIGQSCGGFSPPMRLHNPDVGIPPKQSATTRMMDVRFDIMYVKKDIHYAFFDMRYVVSDIAVCEI